MTYPVGTRVRINRAPAGTRARAGDIGTVFGTSYNSNGQTYQVRVEREFDRTPLQRSRGFDFTLDSSAVRRAPAQPAPAPAPTFSVGDRVRLRDGAVSLRDHMITDPVGTEGEITIDRPDASAGRSRRYSVRTADHHWAVYGDQVEAIPASAPAPAPAPQERNPTVSVGDRVTATEVVNVRNAVGKSGEVVEVTGAQLEVRFDESIPNDMGYSPANRVWTVRGWTREATPAQLTWVPATAENVVPGARIRYINPSAGDVVHVHDEGVITAGSNPSSPSGIHIRMDEPRDGKSLVGSGESAYHWAVSLEDIEIAAPVPEIWVRATTENAVEGARIRYRRTVSDVVFENDEGVIAVGGIVGGIRRIRMDSPRSGAGPMNGDGDSAYNFSVQLDDIEVLVETPRDASGAVTFTDEQKREIARIARQYGNAHGFRGMADGIMRELGVDVAPSNRRVRLTLQLDFTLSGTDEFELPDVAADLNSHVRNSRLSAAVDAILNRRIVRAAGSNVSVASRNFTYLD